VEGNPFKQRQSHATDKGFTPKTRIDKSTQHLPGLAGVIGAPSNGTDN
jgi:hypothetical protein